MGFVGCSMGFRIRSPMYFCLDLIDVCVGFRGGCASICGGLDDPDHFLSTVIWALQGFRLTSHPEYCLVDWLSRGDIKLSLLCMDSALSRERVSTTKQLTRLAGGGDPACTLFRLHRPFLAREFYSQSWFSTTRAPWQHKSRKSLTSHISTGQLAPCPRVE